MNRKEALQLLMDLEKLGISFSMHYSRATLEFEFGVLTVGSQRLTEDEARAVKESVKSLDLEMQPTLYGARIK